MIEDTGDRAAREAATDATSPAAGGSASAATTIVPQFALDAADDRIAAWSGAVIEAADTIDRLVGGDSLPVPEAVRDLATSTTQKLRNLGTRASEQDAADLAAGLQRAAAAHPAASIGVGAAVGAALAVLLVRLGQPADKGTSAGDAGSRSAKPKR